MTKKKCIHFTVCAYDVDPKLCVEGCKCDYFLSSTACADRILSKVESGIAKLKETYGNCDFWSKSTTHEIEMMIEEMRGKISRLKRRVND